MKLEIDYEWCYETVIDGDIEEVDFEERLSLFDKNRITDTLCLVRSEGEDINGLQDRFYAYVKDGQLPEYFENCNIKVPQKYHNELKAYLNK